MREECVLSQLDMNELIAATPSADRKLRSIIQSHPGVRAVCLFGSSTREDCMPDSDVDVLVVVADAPDAKLLRSQARAIRDELGDTVQVCLLTETSIREGFDNRTVFAAHLARESRIVADPDRFMTELLATHPRDAPVTETSARLRSQLEVYADLSWCGGHYLFCLADLYAWSRSGAMLALARRARFEFDRVRVFERLTAVYPELRDAAEIAIALRPFWERVNRRGTRPFPFPAVDSHRETERARDACREILEASA